MAENLNLKTIDTVDTRPFKKLVMTIGELPTSFVESMAYYELLAWFVNYLETVIIPTVNNNAKAVRELQDLFVELRKFVDDYFDNLDVQDEINNKLDQMVDDGTLTTIIEQYIQTRVSWTFDTVTQMKASANLIEGTYARTLGFHEINDGGSGLYYIDDSGTANEMDIISLDNGLIAHLLTTGVLYPEMLGAYGDGTHDDTLALERMIELEQCNIGLINGKTYSYSTTLDINRRYFNFDGNGATLKYTGSSDAIVIDMNSTTSHQRDLTTISNIVINAPNSENVLVLDRCIKTQFENLKIYDFPKNGINLRQACYECVLNNIYLGCRKIAGTVGITGAFGDCEFGNLFGVNVETFIYGKPWGSNCIDRIHAWCFNGSMFDDEPAMDETTYNAWFANTVLIKADVNTGANAWRTYINYCNCDTYYTCFDWKTYWKNFVVNDLQLHETTNLFATDSTFENYVRMIKINNLFCNDTILNQIETTLAGKLPVIDCINGKEYEYVQKVTYTDYNNQSQTIMVTPNKCTWVEVIKPSENLTLIGIKALAFVPLIMETSTATVPIRQPYNNNGGNSFINTTYYADGVTTAYVLLKSNASISSSNLYLAPRITFLT